jgi:hypothetical protein
MDAKYMSLIPVDVLINNLIPYTYNSQPPKLLYDLKNYIEDFSILENIYETMYNYGILYYDLIEFCNNEYLSDYVINTKFINIFQRHIIYKNYTKKMINKYFFNKFNVFYIEKDKEFNDIYKKKSRFLWGLLKPVERIKFINKYVLK